VVSACLDLWAKFRGFGGREFENLLVLALFIVFC